MDFEFNAPSISQIRAKFVLEKVGTISNQTVSLNLFVTGRTGSGKTTLGNRLLGVEYFLSTGHQDCTREVNVIDFPSGLRYFDLPGVCSDDQLENFNRAALGIEQIKEFPVVDELTIVRFNEGDHPAQHTVKLNELNILQFKPDLVFYLIAPDKQFIKDDIRYLKSLLRKHSQVVYVFNLFADKDTNKPYSTDANITDAVQKVIETHTSVFGKGNEPVVSSVNCWTGEGISDLLLKSKAVLEKDKGILFENLIKYQQERTPDEYTRQTKHELIRLLAYLAFQKPNELHKCNQTIHGCCFNLIDFLITLKESSDKTPDSAQAVVDRSMSETINSNRHSNIKSHSAGEGISQFIQLCIHIQEEIFSVVEDAQESLNNFIEKASSYRQAHVSYLTQKIELHSKNVEAILSEISLCAERYDSQIKSINALAAEIQSRIDRYNDRVEELNYYRANYLSFSDKLSLRINRYNARLEGYNSTVEKINSGYVRANEDVLDSLREERDYINAESEAIESKQAKQNKKSKRLDKDSRYIEEECEDIDSQIALKDRKIRQLSLAERSLSELVVKRNILNKTYEDKFEMLQESFELFDRDLGEAKEVVDQGICNKSYSLSTAIEEINNFFSLLENMQNNGNTADYSSIRRPNVNGYLDAIKNYLNEVYKFDLAIKRCCFRLRANLLCAEAISDNTNHHFDEAGDFLYRNSTYDRFGEDGIELLINLSESVGSQNQLQVEVQSDRKLTAHISQQLSSASTELEVRRILEDNSDTLFSEAFIHTFKKAAS